MRPVPIGQLAQQRRASVADEVHAVGSYLDATDRARTMHLQGALLLESDAALNTVILPVEEGFYADSDSRMPLSRRKIGLYAN